MLNLILKSTLKPGVLALSSEMTDGTRSGFSVQATSRIPVVPVSMRHGSCRERLPQPDAWRATNLDFVVNPAGIRAGRSAARSWASVFCHRPPALLGSGRTAKGGCFCAVAMSIDPAKVRAMAPAGEKHLDLLSRRYQASRIPPMVVTKD